MSSNTYSTTTMEALSGHLDDRNYHIAIREWAEQRNLILGSDPKSQFLKLCEEIGEMSEALFLQNIPEARDGVGDALVVLTIISAQLGFNLEEVIKARVARETIERPPMAYLGALGAALARGRTGDALERPIVGLAVRLAALGQMYCGATVNECMDAAWREIKDRKGRMIDGVFVKEEDLN